VPDAQMFELKTWADAEVTRADPEPDPQPQPEPEADEEAPTPEEPT